MGGNEEGGWCDMLGVWLPGVGGKCLGMVTGLIHDSDMWTLAPSEVSGYVPGQG